jgi:hypothetical protein
LPDYTAFAAYEDHCAGKTLFRDFFRDDRVHSRQGHGGHGNSFGFCKTKLCERGLRNK